MSATAALVQGFAYGEHPSGPQRRSLGYRPLAPAEPEPTRVVTALRKG